MVKYLIIFISVLLLGCSITRSSLIDTDIPTVCKMDLECRYFHREGDKTACVEYSKTCERTLRFDYCIGQQEQDRCRNFMNLR